MDVKNRVNEQFLLTFTSQPDKFTLLYHHSVLKNTEDHTSPHLHPHPHTNAHVSFAIGSRKMGWTASLGFTILTANRHIFINLTSVLRLLCNKAQTTASFRMLNNQIGNVKPFD